GERFLSDLVQHAGRDHVEAAEMEAGSVGRFEERGELGAVAGGEDDRVVRLFGAVDEADLVGPERFDPRPDRDRALADEVEGADVEERNALVDADLRHRAVGQRFEPEALERTEVEPRDEAGDGVADEVREQLEEKAPGEDGNAKEVARHDVDRAADRERGMSALLVEIDGDLAAGVAEADDEDALALERRAAPVFGAVQDFAAEAVLSWPGRPLGH